MRSRRTHEEQERGGRGAVQRKPGTRTLTGAVQRRSDERVHAAAAHGIAGPGERLPFLDVIQASFGAHDVGDIQAHADAGAAEGARAMGAHAFAAGNHVAFASAPDLHTAAHEAAHVVQQRGEVDLSGGVGERGDRYERHADEVADRVVRGESAEALLGDAGRTGGGGSPAVQRYEAGEHARAGGTEKMMVKGVELDYGHVIAMGDLFGSPDELMNATPEELRELVALIEREKTGGEEVGQEEWQQATRGRYVDLTADNEAHFAPSNALVDDSGTSKADHKSAWEHHHRRAIQLARAGDRDQAMIVNAFADHFLTDAFAAGHLFNKADVMAGFNQQLDKVGPDFFTAIANTVWADGALAKRFSAHETFEPFALGWRPNISDAGRLATLLKRIHRERPQLIASAVVKGVHDKLNHLPGGLPVANAHRAWQLSGDGTLNPETLAEMQAAVACSQRQVAAQTAGPAEPDFEALFAEVWAFTPQPVGEGLTTVQGALAEGTNLYEAPLLDAVGKLIVDNHELILAELVKLEKLRPD